LGLKAKVYGAKHHNGTFTEGADVFPQEDGDIHAPRERVLPMKPTQSPHLVGDIGDVAYVVPP
jgi:hypothetical protein